MNSYEQTGFSNHLDLRIEREIRGISLEEISRDSRFSINQLRDFEAKRFDKLPNEIVLRSLTNLYTQKLGLDPDMVRLEYPVILKRSGQSHIIEKRGLKKFAQDIQIGPLIGFFLTTLALLVFLWPLKIEKIFRDSVIDMPDLIDNNVSRSDAMFFFDSCFRNKVSFNPDSSQNEEIAVVRVKPSDLNISVESPTWIRVDDITRGINSIYSLFPGEIKSFSIQDETIVRFENPEYVSITNMDQSVFHGGKLSGAIQFVPDKNPDIIKMDNR